MKKVLIGFVLSFVFLSVSAYATDYYVDATNGDNGNLGTSPEQAWKTISKVNGETFLPGDNIYFERGEEWREILIPPSSGSSGSQITFGAYGTGNKPIITALGDLSGWTISGNWIEEVGVGTNIWSKSLAYDPDRAILDLTEYKEAEVEANITSTYRWHYDSGSTKFYVYATENPSSFYSSMEIRQDSKTVYFLDVGYITMTGLDIQSAQGAVRIRRGVGHIIIDGCDIGKYSKAGISISDSSYNEIKNNVIDSQIPDWSSDSYFDSVDPVGDGILMTTSQDTADSSYNKIYNNIVKDWGHTGISLQNIVSDTNTIHHNEIYLNEIYAQNSPDMRGWTVSGSAVGRCTNNKLYQNNCHDMSVSCQVGGNDNEFYYNLIYNMSPTIAEPNDGDGIRLAVEFGGDSAKICESNKIYNNIIYNMTDGHGILMVHWASGTDYLENNLFRNNIIVHFPGTNKHGIYMTNFPTYIKNNTFENNLIWSSGVSAVVDYYAVPKTIAEFNALNGDTGNVIKNNIFSDPLFVNVSNNDFHLQSGSPCIDNGTDVNLTQDYDGNAVPQGDGVDIGAYEYTRVYYVDATLGNDSYNGLYPTFESGSDGPWQTLSKVQTVWTGGGFNAGDTIKFKKGEEWREAISFGSGCSGSLGNRITVTAYGSGNLPIFNGADLITPRTSWTNASGDGANLWYCSWTKGSTYQVFMDGTRGTEEANQTNLSAEFEWWFDDPNDRIYVYSPTDPDTRYTSPGVEISDPTRGGGVPINIGSPVSYVDVSNINVKYSHHIGIQVIGSNNRIYDCTIEYTGKRGIYTNSGSNIEIYDNTISYAGVDMPTHEHGIYLGDNSGYVDVYRNDISHSWNSGIKIDSCSNVNVYQNWVHDNNDEDWGGSAEILIATTNEDVNNINIYYNLIKALTGDGMRLQSTIAGKSVTNVNVYNNVIYGSGLAYPIMVRNLGLAFSTVAIKNNIIHANNNDYAYYYDDITDLTRDNNCYYDWAHATYCGNLDGAWKTWAETVAIETHTIDSDPLFVNAPNDDFHLQYNSPCIDNGTDVGLTQDYEGNSVPQGNGTDIGAYEYVSGETLPADLDNDGDVDILDLGIIAGDFGKTSGFNPDADTDNNGEIDVYDVVFVASRFT